MRIYVGKRKKNCNHCIYREELSRHLDLDDYCAKSMKRTGRINMDIDCPLEELEDKRV